MSNSTAIIGHRGARGLWPENTLAGFVAAIEIGVHGIELDVGVTRDGIPVVHHDPTLNRDTTRDAHGRWLAKGKAGNTPLHTLSLSELRRYDVGAVRPRSRYGLRFPGQRRVPGTHVPTLDDALDLLFSAGVDITIEIKSLPPLPELTPPPARLAEAVIERLRAADAVSKVLMTSFDWRVLEACRAMEPGLAISCLTIESLAQDTIRPKGDNPGWTAGLNVADFGGSVPRMVKAFGSNSWSPYVGNVDANSVADARSAGLRVVTWTANKPQVMDNMLKLGVDGIITDWPDRLRSRMAAAGHVLPAPGGRAAGAQAGE